MLQNGFDIASLMHGNGAHLPIPFYMYSDKDIQLAEVAHLEFAFEARLQLMMMSTLLAKMMKSSANMITITI